MAEKLLRVKQVLQRVPVSKSTWWAKVKSGQYPQPVRHLGSRITAWKESDIDNLLKGGRDAEGGK